MMLGYRIVRPLRLWPRPWRVVENRDEGGGTRTVVLQGSARASFRFMPGQFAWRIEPLQPAAASNDDLLVG
jgi:hypothetical protein